MSDCTNFPRFSNGWRAPEPDARTPFSIHFRDGEFPYESAFNARLRDGTTREVDHFECGGVEYWPATDEIPHYDEVDRG